ncbi:MAG: hypothetical protein BWY85_00018 [Firmicutes bacterium ADurb.Bin506]|nr:MAG: hypothetical protein BWY85_00018 [Firmicutes bacterium ADurb.Bin506]
MADPRTRALEDACESLQVLMIQIDAAHDLVRALLPEEVATELHYNGYQRAAERFPAYKRPITLLKDSSLK